MKQQYIQVMKERGYEQEWEREPYIFTRNEGKECYVVLLLERGLSVAQLQEKRRQLEGHYSARGYDRIYQLCIICHNNGMFSEELLALVSQAPNVWLFAADQNRMYQYENQPLEFDGLCHGLEAIPTEPKLSPLSFHKKEFPYVTVVLVLVNVVCFLVPVWMGQHEKWLDEGGNYWGFVFGKGEAYRLWTYMFLHVDVRHLFNNMIGVLGFGLLLEPMLGHVKYAVIYLGSGLGSGLLSFLIELIRENHVLSVGASGAVFGLTGALLAMVLFRKKQVPWLSVRRILFLIVISLYSGFATPGVDNIGHIGGLLAGFLLTALINFVSSLFPEGHPFNRNNCT